VPEGPPTKDIGHPTLMAAGDATEAAPGPPKSPTVAPNPRPGYTSPALRLDRSCFEPLPRPPTPGVTGEYTPAATTRAGVPRDPSEASQAPGSDKRFGHGSDREAQPRNHPPRSPAPGRNAITHAASVPLPSE